MSGQNGYLKSREHLRRDFVNRCAYCQIHENRAGGPEQFWIDHFQPRSKAGAANNYANLYWSCMGCNWIKSDQWPSPAEVARGYRFADPCQEQDYGAHFKEDENGTLVALTLCGSYHIDRLRLNRPARLQVRRERKIMQHALQEHIAMVIKLIETVSERGATEIERQAIRQILDLIQTLQVEMSDSIPLP
jgi:hypothetical protein